MVLRLSVGLAITAVLNSVVACNHTESPITLAISRCDSAGCVSAGVKGSLYGLQQPTANSCWATVLTMLFSWKEQRRENTDSLLKRFGNKFVQLYRQSATRGIGISDEIELYQKAGLTIMRQLDPSIEGWAEFIRNFGPLSLTVDASPPFGGTVHAILIVGIRGKTDGSNTTLYYIDPQDGELHTTPFMTFLKMYEAKFAVDWPIQIIHF
ncbi:MAG: papain-like cysteine protease family protein [Chitinophagaceae bacterium]